MKTLRDNAVFKTNVKHLVLTGTNTDSRIAVIESLVAENYNTTVHELDVYYKDSNAKLMCCFLMHNLLNYSVSSVAKKYRIYPTFLQNKINEHYKLCLTDQAFFKRVTALKNAFFNGISQQAVLIN